MRNNEEPGPSRWYGVFLGLVVVAVVALAKDVAVGPPQGEGWLAWLWWLIQVYSLLFFLVLAIAAVLKYRRALGPDVAEDRTSDGREGR